MNNETKSPTRPTVLLVDDDVRVRQTLALLFRLSRTWEVIGMASDRVTTLDLAVALRPHLILLDLHLADGESLDLLPQFHALEPRPVVVVLSADTGATWRSQALALGADGYLDKTAGPEMLLQNLRSIYARSKQLVV